MLTTASQHNSCGTIYGANVGVALRRDLVKLCRRLRDAVRKLYSLHRLAKQVRDCLRSRVAFRAPSFREIQKLQACSRA